MDHEIKGYNEQINFLKSFIVSEKTKISKFLADNPDVIAIDLASDLVFVGLPLVYVAAITGVSIYEALNIFLW